MKALLVLMLVFSTFYISSVVAENTGKNLAESTVEKKNEFIKKMDAEIEQLSAEIEELRVKTKDKSNATIEKLEARKKTLQDDMKKLKNSSVKAFDRMEIGIKKAWGALKESVQDAKKEFE